MRTRILPMPESLARCCGLIYLCREVVIPNEDQLVVEQCCAALKEPFNDCWSSGALLGVSMSNSTSAASSFVMQVVMLQ